MIQLWNGQTAPWALDFAPQSQDDSTGKMLELQVACSEKEGQVLTVGLGKKEDFTALVARRAVAQGIRELQKLSVTQAILKTQALHDLAGENILPAIVEAARLTLFQPENWKSKDTPQNFTLYIQETQEASTQSTFDSALELADAVVFARDLVNKPGSMLTPVVLADVMEKSGKEAGLDVEVLSEKQMHKLGMGSLLAVGNSSANPPRLITLSYQGDPKSTEVLALVGKGVTFDTGGYNLKPTAAIAGMQGDMAGAAAVCAAILAVSKLGLKLNVLAVVPTVENRISPDSFLPGDVLTSLSGKTIEIGNTDAEGRLILADAITYAIRHKKATKIVDIATLTGAVVAMLGHTVAGLVTNNDEFYADFMQAANKAGEQYWRLPTFPEYRKMIDSPVADLHNMSNDGCGTITAGLFIENFAEEKPWIHLDIAGTAWVDRPRTEFQSKGATGAGVTTLYHLCRQLAEK